jgi:hypothetical protein
MPDAGRRPVRLGNILGTRQGGKGKRASPFVCPFGRPVDAAQAVTPGHEPGVLMTSVNVAIDVPLNTMLADLDEALRTLLKRDLARHGFNGVEVLFDAPDKEWSAGLSSPAVNLFLYNVREARELRPIEWELRHDANGRSGELRPPLVVDASYAVTAWTRAVEDEHRLLSQVLAILYAYGELPGEILAGTLANGSQPFPLNTRVARERQDDKSDFWTAVGGQFKASLDFVVTVSCPSGTLLERGPEVRTQTVRMRHSDGAPARIEEAHRVGGLVTDANGEPVANAWVVIADIGWTATDRTGRFRFDPLRPSTYRCVARGPDGAEAEAELIVPGHAIELRLGPAKPRGSGKATRR